jgi:hypothetical protein
MLTESNVAFVDRLVKRVQDTLIIRLRTGDLLEEQAESEMLRQAQILGTIQEFDDEGLASAAHAIAYLSLFYPDGATFFGRCWRRNWRAEIGVS